MPTAWKYILLLILGGAPFLVSCGTGLCPNPVPGQCGIPSLTPDDEGDPDAEDGDEEEEPETPDAIVTDGLVFHVSARQANGIDYGTCTSDTWVDLQGDFDQGGLQCIVWKGTRNANNPARFELDGSRATTNSTYDFEDIADDFSFEVWALPSVEETVFPQASAGNNCCGIAVKNFAWYPKGPGSLGAGQAMAGFTLATNAIQVFEHSSGHFPSVLVHELEIKNWTQVAVVFANSRSQLYVNGDFVKDGEVSTKTVYPPIEGIGGGFFGTFRGSIAVARLYNRSLNPSEIEANYLAQKDRFAVPDADGDGWISTLYGGADCDDSSSTTRPGNEICNDSIDTDCDGNVDEDDVDCEFDVDGDGFYDANFFGDDCDDNDANIHPGATEDGSTCGDSIDQDCDGSDLDCATIDIDGDGYTGNDGDCNESDASISPAAVDVCDNTIDEDCQGGDVACLTDGQSDSNGTTYHFFSTGETWGAAAYVCATLGGYLLDVGDDAENNYLKTRLPDVPIWTGSNDLEAEGVYETPFDTAATFLPWASAPDSTPDCVETNGAGPQGSFSTEDCSSPLAYVCESGGDGARYPDALQYIDADGDGETPDGGDCDDQDPAVNTSGMEPCNDDIDGNCNGLVDCSDPVCSPDMDSDGYMAPGSCPGDDCNDGDATIYPGAVDLCGDGIDNDCDSSVDEGCDDDSDGFYDQAGGGDDCDDTNSEINPDAFENCSSVTDENCDVFTGACAGENTPFALGGRTFRYSSTSVGWDAAAAACEGLGMQLATFGTAEEYRWVMEQVPYDVWVGANDLLSEGTFSDTCNFSATTFFSPGFSNDASSNCVHASGKYMSVSNCGTSLYFLCATGVGCTDSYFVDGDSDGYTDAGGDCDDTDAAISPGAAEVPDGIDNDCDSSVDEGFDADGDGYIDVGFGGNDCNDMNASIHPGAIENCDSGSDEDCDGQADCADSDCYYDGDGDTWPGLSGSLSCYGGMLDCNDSDNAIGPGISEVCGNGIDDNCDGNADEGC